MWVLREKNNAKGFTLVELAIVLVIIGILIGGMLKGQKMIEQARVAATVKQIHAYMAAVESFENTYGQIPGDLEDAHKLLPNCGICDNSGALINAGDYVVGREDWNFQEFQSYPLNATTWSDDVTGCDGTASCRGTYSETVLFWYELKQANLITGGVTGEGVTQTGMTYNDITWGGAMPETKIGGGFWVGNSDGEAPTPSNLGRLGGDQYPPIGTILMMQPYPFPQFAATEPGMQVLKPHLAAQLDRKLDDGVPNSGMVQAYGDFTSCFNTYSPVLYVENVESKDCGLIIGIKN